MVNSSGVVFMRIVPARLALRWSLLWRWIRVMGVVGLGVVLLTLTYPQPTWAQDINVSVIKTPSPNVSNTTPNFPTMLPRTEPSALSEGSLDATPPHPPSLESVVQEDPMTPVSLKWLQQTEQELERYRTDQRLKELINAKLSSSPEIQDRIELEVDRAFERTTTILDILLVILTSIPVLAALGVWLLRRSVISELVTEVRSQLEKEVFAQLKQQKLSSIQEIEKIKAQSLEQTKRMVTDARLVLDELKAQIAIANEELTLLKSKATSDIESMVADAQQKKDQTIQDIVKLLPVSMQETLPPEVKPQIGKLTAALDMLKAAIPQLNFTSSDYFKQANALFFESRYEEAITTYERALQLNPDLYEAWYGKASTLMILQRYAEAVVAYQQAHRLKPESYETLTGLGSALMKAQHYEAAVNAYGQAVDLKADDPLIWYSRGNAYSELQQYDLALADYEQALALKTDFISALQRRCQVLTHLHRHPEALAVAEQLLTLKPDEADLWYLVATIQAHLGNVTQVVTALNTAIQRADNYRQRAQTDPVFTALLDDPKLSRLLSDPG